MTGSPAGAETSTTRSPAAGSAAQAAVPRLVRFSGTLRDAGARPLHGPVDVTFSLYAIKAGGEPLWFETQTVEADALGRYTALLGAMHPDGLPIDLFASGEARWLGVSVGKLPEQPRVLLVSVPYALKAGDAETLGGQVGHGLRGFRPTQGAGAQRTELTSQQRQGRRENPQRADQRNFDPRAAGVERRSVVVRVQPGERQMQNFLPCWHAFL